MGERYILQLKCGKCGTLNKEIWYAPSCCSLSFNCRKCEQLNWIKQDFIAEPITKKEFKKRQKAEGCA